jgi:hypothetical protein
VYVTKWELYDEEEAESSTDSSSTITGDANGSSLQNANKQQLQCIPVQCEIASSEQVTHISVRSDELRLAVADSEGR